jgi:hypothetical protein
MSARTCAICGQEWAYSIANPTGEVGAVSICEPHYRKLMEAQAAAWHQLVAERESQ